MSPVLRNAPFDFLKFALLYIFTLGIYPVYFVAKRVHEQSQYLHNIQELLIAAHQREDQRSS